MRPKLDKYADSWFFRWGPITLGKQAGWRGLVPKDGPPTYHNYLLHLGRLHIVLKGER